ncbi:MAG TPA: Gfo/Idh/MocA family oxidoreductase [Chloroflexia bacterium]|nr:Gfo/Idh/MocA family oxidoreductase [Chloroflexia bacterium]
MADTAWRAGVIGTGFIGPVHVEALRRLGIEVVALAGHSTERTAEKARRMHIARAYGSAEELIADPAVQVVHITSPNHLHYAHARAALLAGKHVVCEKPLAMDARESRALVELAQQSGLVHAVNFNLRFYPLAQHARALVHTGRLGAVYSVHGAYLQDWLLLASDWNWRLEPEYGGELRAVADIGSHWLDLTGFITGLRVEAVMADFKTFLPVRQKPTRPVETFTGKLATAMDYVEQPIRTEDYASVLIRYEGGARGVMTVSQVSAGRKNRLCFEIDGAQAALAFDGENPNELWIGHRDRPNEILIKDPALLEPEARRFAGYPGGHAEGFPDSFKGLYQAVYGYLEAGDFAAAPDFPTFADGHRALLAGAAILRSAREDRWVTITEVG